MIWIIVIVFSQGSVVVNFDLWFNQRIEASEAEQQLTEGLQEVESAKLVIDVGSIQISGRYNHR